METDLTACLAPLLPQCWAEPCSQVFFAQGCRGAGKCMFYEAGCWVPVADLGRLQMVRSEQKEESTIQALEQLPEVEGVCPPRPWKTK